MAASISSSIVASLKAFNALIEQLNSTDPNDLPETLSMGQWEDELGRLRMWAANIGAHRTGQSFPRLSFARRIPHPKPNPEITQKCGRKHMQRSRSTI